MVGQMEEWRQGNHFENCKKSVYLVKMQAFTFFLY